MDQNRESSNRADAVRQRRTSRPGKGTKTGGSKRAAKTSEPVRPPLLMRGSFAGTAVPENRRGKKAKRRYDLALGTSGAEIRLPALPKVAIGWRFLSGFLVVGLFVLIYTLWNFPALQVETLNVEGLKNLKSEDINVIAGVSGKAIFLVEPAKIQRDLLAAFPELENVVVEVKIPAKVSVKVVERQPLLTWQQDGQTLWVDGTGVTFPKRGEAGPAILVEAEDAPISMTVNKPLSSLTEGEAAAEASPQEPTALKLPVDLVNSVLAMAEEAPENTPLVYSNQHGLGWKDPGGWQVFFGKDTAVMDMKLNVYKAIVKRLKKEDIQPALISVEYVHAPYYRLER